MTSPKAETGNTDNRHKGDLDRCYGRIGISAVAAALSCKGDSKTPASAANDDRR